MYTHGRRKPAGYIVPNLAMHYDQDLTCVCVCDGSGIFVGWD